MTSSLAIVRSLGKSDHSIILASSTTRPITSYSRFVDQTITYPDPLEQENSFLNWVNTSLEKNLFDLCIPVTERTVVPLLKLNNDKIILPSEEALESVLDKDKTIQLAEKLDISVPGSITINNINEISTASDKITLPIVLKPGRSIGRKSNSRRQLRVEYATSQQELNTKTSDFLQYGPVILQEYSMGKGVGIELIADHGEIKYAFQHLRLHEIPLTGGGSSFRVSTEIEPVLYDASEKLIKALSWHGVAMVEFKWNPETGDYALMEINGRFWGSLPLSIAAGADFPAMLIELYTTGNISPRVPYRRGIYCRNLANDIYWHELVVRRDAPASLFRFPSKKQMLVDLIKVFSPLHYFDVQTFRDPLPGIIDISRILANYYRRFKSLIQHRLFLSQQKKAWESGKVADKLNKASSILFMCYGNINRSALAERCFSPLPHPDMSVYSAGFHQEENRPADPQMVRVASEHGINMHNWQSRCVTQEMVQDSDIIFVMEYQHYLELAERYPESKGRIFLLGPAAKEIDSPEIADPYGKTLDAYQKCAHQTKTSVCILLNLIKK